MLESYSKRHRVIGLTRAGLDLVADDPALVDHHRTHAVRAHLLERAGDTDQAVIEYRSAARLTRSEPERRYLAARARAISG